MGIQLFDPSGRCRCGKFLPVFRNGNNIYKGEAGTMVVRPSRDFEELNPAEPSLLPHLN